MGSGNKLAISICQNLSGSRLEWVFCWPGSAEKGMVPSGPLACPGIPDEGSRTGIDIVMCHIPNPPGFDTYCPVSMPNGKAGNEYGDTRRRRDSPSLLQ